MIKRGDEIQEMLYTIQYTHIYYLLISYPEVQNYVKPELYTQFCVHEILFPTLTEEHRLSLFKNRILRMSGPTKEEATEKGRKLHNDKLHNLYSLHNIISITKAPQYTMNIKLWIGKPRKRDHLEDIAIDEITLRYISKKKEVMVWTRYKWFRMVSNGRLL
jgi:hypothetical protein